MRLVFVFFLILVIASCQTSNSSYEVSDNLKIDITVTPVDSDSWMINVKTSEPVQSMVFSNQVGTFRKSTWQFDNSKAVMQQSEDNDIVLLSDGSPFTTLNATVTAFKENERKAYVPFADFSNGAIRVYSAQFRMRPGDKNGKALDREFTNTLYFNPGPFDEIFANNTWSNEPVVYDQARADNELDGYLIFGRVDQIKFEGGDLLLDDGLPQWVRDGLLEMLPTSSEYFTNRMGPKTGPETTTIISFSPNEDSENSSVEGGVLADQIHFHISGSGWSEPNEELSYRLGWVAAHEIAHVWNAFGRYKPAYFETSENSDWQAQAHWLHEGGAEMLTYKAMLDTKALPVEFLNMFVKENYDVCMAALTKAPLNIAGNEDRFPDYYDCGFVFGLLTEASCKSSNKDYIDIWQQMVQISPNDRYGQSDYLNALSTCDNSQKAVSLIKTATLSTMSNAEQQFNEAFLSYGVNVIDGYPALP